jgi:hypothetical protein
MYLSARPAVSLKQGDMFLTLKTLGVCLMKRFAYFNRNEALKIAYQAP